MLLAVVVVVLSIILGMYIGSQRTPEQPAPVAPNLLVTEIQEVTPDVEVLL